jgi:hypothetical protein
MADGPSQISGLKLETPYVSLNHLVGTLVIAVMTMTAVIRIFSHINVLLGLVLAVMPLLIKDVNLVLTLNSGLKGLLIIALSFSKGKIKENYGLWDKYVV